MSPRAVLHVTALGGGGVDRHLRDLARAIDRRHVLWHAGERADVLEIAQDGRYFPLDPARLEAEPEALAAWLRAEGVGLVHLHSTAPCARRRAEWAAGRLGARLLVTLHDVLFLRPDAFDAPGAPPDPAWLAGTTGLLRGAAAVFAPSEFIARLAREHVPGLVVEVIPNGSPARVRRPEVAPRADFAAARPRHAVAVIGAVGPHKGSDLLDELPAHLAGSGIGVVVIGYLDRQLFPGWRSPGALYVHGAYADEDLPALMAAYGVEIALFPNRAPESFSYALSDAWAAGIPALAAPSGALGERIAAHGGGWLLPEAFGAAEVAAALRARFAPEGAAELARVRSALSRPDPGRVPTLEAMARSLDAFYARFGIDPSGPEAADPRAIERLLAANIDGSVFRQELVRLADEFAQVKAALDGERGRTEKFERESREWMAKLEGDVASLQAELAREVEERRRLGQDNVQLGIHKQAFDLLPALVRKLLLKKILDAGS